MSSADDFLLKVLIFPRCADDFLQEINGSPKGFQAAGSGGQNLVFNRPRLVVVKMDQNGLYVTLRGGIWAPRPFPDSTWWHLGP